MKDNRGGSGRGQGRKPKDGKTMSFKLDLETIKILKEKKNRTDFVQKSVKHFNEQCNKNYLTNKKQINYLEIVLNGYYNQNDRNHLEKYFQTEFLEAKKKHFIDSEVFFSGCLNEILIFKNDIQKQISKKKLQLIQYSSQDGEINNDFVKRLKEQIEYQEINGITNIRLGDGTILHLKINEINFIETAIKKAYKK